MTSNLTIYNEDGSETPVPFKWEICSTCQGNGKSSAYLGAFTREQIEEEGPEFCEEYFSGEYDRACDECGGGGKVKVANLKELSKKDRATYRAQREDDRACRATERMERLMEGGWREEGWR